MATYGFGGSSGWNNKPKPTHTPWQPKPAKFDLPGGGAAQAGVPDLNALYQMLLGSISQQPPPANTSLYNEQSIDAYNQTGNLLAGHQAEMLAQQAEMERIVTEMQNMADLPVADYRGLENLLMAEANRQPRARSVMLYGYS